MINSRELKHLHPKVKLMCEAFIKKCKEQKIDVIITSTYRDHESQNELYAIGRTKPGKKVTKARAGYSYHNFRCAFDFVPVVNGKAMWLDTETFNRCGEIAESVGLEWAGRWKSSKELAHCQYTGGLSIADLRAGKQII